MIRRTLRFGIRLGLLAGIGLALFKLVKGRRSASEYGSPSADWAPAPAAPAHNPNLPKPVPEPELVTPVELHEIIEKKATVKAEPDPAPSPAVALVGESAVKKAAKAAPPAAAGPVKKVAPKKAAAKKAPAPAAEVTPAAKKPTPVKKAPKSS